MRLEMINLLLIKLKGVLACRRVERLLPHSPAQTLASILIRRIPHFQNFLAP
jgi:hypothetical protein